MHYIFSGLTAAGKSTHAKLLAKRLEVPYVSASAVMFDLIDRPQTSGRGVWRTDFDAVEKQRVGDDIDRAVDERITSIAESLPSAVFDSWAMPFLWTAPAMRIWIDSDPSVRVRNCFNAFGESGETVTIDECEDMVERKDKSTQERFMRLYGFNLFEDYRNFEIVLTITPDSRISEIAHQLDERCNDFLRSRHENHQAAL